MPHRKNVFFVGAGASAHLGRRSCSITSSVHRILLGAASYRPLVFGYALFGLVLAAAFVGLSPAAEARAASASTGAAHPARFGLHRSRRVVLKLSALFAIDSFGGGFVIQSIVAYW